MAGKDRIRRYAASSLALICLRSSSSRGVGMRGSCRLVLVSDLLTVSTVAAVARDPSPFSADPRSTPSGEGSPRPGEHRSADGRTPSHPAPIPAHPTWLTQSLLATLRPHR